MDARLRPHGKGAPLAANRDSYVSYIATEAQTWELQALHRCRCAWGDGETLFSIRRAAKSRVAAENLDAMEREIRAMRGRIEENPAGGEGTIDIKRSSGGIVDVEFFVQATAMQRPLMWTDAAANYFAALDMLDRTGDTWALKANYKFLREVENTWRLMTGGADSAVPVQGRRAEALARAMHFEGVVEFVGTLEEARRVIRQETGDVVA